MTTSPHSHHSSITTRLDRTSKSITQCGLEHASDNSLQPATRRTAHATTTQHHKRVDLESHDHAKHMHASQTSNTAIEQRSAKAQQHTHPHSTKRDDEPRPTQNTRIHIGSNIRARLQLPHAAR